MSADAPLVAHRKKVAGSERGFGAVFAGVFAIVGLWPLIDGDSPRWCSLLVAALFLAAAIVFPRALTPFNGMWGQFGLLLPRIVKSVVITLIFGIAVIPTGLILRALGKDLLRLKREPEKDSYWLPRHPPGPSRGSMSKQF